VCSTDHMPRFDRKEIREQKLDRLPDLLEATPLQLSYQLASGHGRIESHGSYRSDAVRIRPGAVKPGGITMDYALHTWTLSLTQLRRLRFPIRSAESESGIGAAAGGTVDATKASQTPTPEQRDGAARTVLAALALYALALQQQQGYWLRSRCELVPSEPVLLHIVGGSGKAYSLGGPTNVKTILDAALKEAKDVGVTWSENVTILEATEKLKGLVKGSDECGPEPEPEPEPGEEPADGGAPS